MTDLTQFEIGEQIALAIRYAMQNEMSYFRSVMTTLREQNYTDAQIFDLFMEIGKIVFNESDEVITEEDE